jgi:uncharacterized protein (DUF697 family)
MMAATLEHDSKREQQARGIVNRNILWSAGIGTIAIPVVDLVGITAFNLKMLKELSDLYDTPFRENIGKSFLASLVSGLGSRTLAMGVVGSTLKAIPGLGSLFGFLAVPASAAALTYAVGRVFTMHFEMGGQFLDFNPEKAKQRFVNLYESYIKKAESTGSANVPDAADAAGATA